MDIPNNDEKKKSNHYCSIGVGYIIWVLCLAAVSGGFVYGITSMVQADNQYQEVQCIVVNCIVSNYTCSRKPCFSIYTTMMYNNIYINFTRQVATSWNCTAEYPTYTCYYGNNQLFNYKQGWASAYSTMLLVWMSILLAIIFIAALVLGPMACFYLFCDENHETRHSLHHI